MEIDNLKKQIRNEIKAQKQNYSTEIKRALSARILEKLEEEPKFINAKTVMLFWSIKDEVYTHDFISKWYPEKRIILPCVDGDNLVLKEFTGLDKMIAGENFNIPEPDGKEFDKIDEIDLIIVPGIAFDKKNNRMGRGKAYYDKFLNTLNSYKIGVCFSFQLLYEIPVDKHDVKMDMVITD